MANRIAVSADTIATITSTSASNANRIADFIRGNVATSHSKGFAVGGIIVCALQRSRTLLSLADSWHVVPFPPRSLAAAPPACNRSKYEPSQDEVDEVRTVFLVGVSYFCAAFDSASFLLSLLSGGAS